MSCSGRQGGGSCEHSSDLQKILNIIYEYSKKYRFEFNCGKSNVLVFGKSVNSMTKCKIQLGNKDIPQVTSVLDKKRRVIH